mgnify:CR=1 FL=1
MVLVLFLSIQAVPVRADNGIGQGLADLAKKVIDGMIIVGGILVALLWGYNWLRGLVARGFGSALAESNSFMTVFTTAVLFIFLVFTIPAVNAFIDAVMKYHSAEGIHIPTP